MVTTVLWILVWATVVVAAIVTAAFVAGRWFFVERYPDEIHYARTEDNWRIAVTRYRPDHPNGAKPVLVCHGIGSTHLAMDLTEELSFVRALAAAGFDTWLVELRGRGLSAQPRLFSTYDYDWSFDEYVERDAPAAIDAVLRATGAASLHWVGFSLGALVGYGVMSDARLGPKIASAVSLAGCATFSFQGKYLFQWPLRNLRWLRHRLIMRLLAPVSGYWRPTLLQNPENITADSFRLFLVNGTANFSRNEMLQYADWIGGNHFRSIDHRRDYRKEMAKITAPMLFVAGNKDRLAPPPSVKDTYELVASEPKRLVIASRGQSCEANYGHLDLVLGKSAPKDIYPLIARWLEEVEGDGADRPCSETRPAAAAPE